MYTEESVRRGKRNEIRIRAIAKFLKCVTRNRHVVRPDPRKYDAEVGICHALCYLSVLILVSHFPHMHATLTMMVF